MHLALLLLVWGCQPDQRKDASGTAEQAGESVAQAVPPEPARLQSARERADQAKSGPAAPAMPAQESGPKTKQAAAKEMREKISALPPKDRVEKIVNPSGLQPYQGPTGDVIGTILSAGDAPLVLEKALANMEKDCTLSRQMFASVPREGKGRTLADAFVAVTGYQGYLPARDPVVTVVASGCAWDRRTIGMTFGQDLQVRSADRRPYVPELIEQPMPAQLFVLPDAEPVSLPPRSLGQFRLVDSMRLYNVADLVVVPYRTFDVTGLDGRFAIKGVPVGKAKINALLPTTGAVSGADIEVREGQVTEVTLELRFVAADIQQKIAELGTGTKPRTLPNLR